MNDTYAAVLVERFGTVAEWVREARRRPAPTVVAAMYDTQRKHKERL